MKNLALGVSGLVFAAMAVGHAIRYSKAWDVVIGPHTIPLEWSLYSGIVAAVLAIWMFIAAASSRS